MRIVFLLAPLAILATSSALGFGTINSTHQSAEHERITRRAFTCASLPSDNSCLEPGTLDLFAGTTGDWGAIGYPDVSVNFFKAKAHCDDGDVPGGLDECRTWMKSHFDEAITDADSLVDANGTIAPNDVALSCVWTFNIKGKAKCNVLQDLGFVLHAAQDFYSHSNWTDSTAEDPYPGLGNTGPAPAISLRTDEPFPDGLISGCYSIWGNCDGRPTHEQLNKDLGDIPLEGPVGAGTTDRGKLDDNFANAVNAAVDDTKDKLALLRETLIDTYGATRGTMMICAITHDDPVSSC